MVRRWVGAHGGFLEEMGMVIEGVWGVHREYQSVEGVEGRRAFGF